ncbi:MAG TPA: hypothetical protein VG713_01420, partial [Pirellulales bacterium]|nr:hypothetical protein [Pirellulales bacterium]
MRVNVRTIAGFAWLPMIVACAAQADAPAAGAAATVAEAAKVLDLTTFPLMDKADEPSQRNVAALTYNVAASVSSAYEFQQQQLGDAWREVSPAYVSSESASGVFARSGFTVTVMVFPTGMPGQVRVAIANLGNVPLDKLPLPDEAKPFFAGPANAMFLSDAPVESTKQTCQKLLLAQGWQPYGTAGDSLFFKQNAVRLLATISAAPAQGGKTMLTYSTELMS